MLNVKPFEGKLLKNVNYVQDAARKMMEDTES
jgi:hypothetical protein